MSAAGFDPVFEPTRLGLKDAKDAVEAMGEYIRVRTGQNIFGPGGIGKIELIKALRNANDNARRDDIARRLDAATAALAAVVDEARAAGVFTGH